MLQPADDRVTYIGHTDHRNSGVRFGIRQRDRRSHFYICGKTGTGKSHLMRMMVMQDMSAGQGCALLDPHGDVCAAIVRDASEFASHRLIVVEPHNPNSSWRLNPFGGVAVQNRPRAAAGLVETFKKLWADDWGPRLEHLLRNVVLTLLETENATFADIPPLLADGSFRSRTVNGLTDPVVRAFWTQEFDRYSFGFRSVIVAPLQNKVGALLTDPITRRFLTEPGQLLNLRGLMDQGGLAMFNLDKGQLGEGPSAVIGSLVLSGIAQAALTRTDTPEAQRRDFFVYADEFQTWTTLAIATMLAELRKYHVGLVLAHQHLSQLAPEIRDAVFGNAGTLAAFRVSAADASYLSREFAPVIRVEDLTSLERYHLYIRLLIDGTQSRPFSATTIANVVAD